MHYKMENEKRLCKSCGKTLRSIGYDRANRKIIKIGVHEIIIKNVGSN